MGFFDPPFEPHVFRVRWADLSSEDGKEQQEKVFKRLMTLLRRGRFMSVGIDERGFEVWEQQPPLPKRVPQKGTFR